MKRILQVLVVAAVLALTASMALATHHASKSQKLAAAPAAGAVCTDPTHCPPGACKLSTSQTASMSTAQKGAVCTDPKACPTSCSQGKAAATTAVAAK
jgi:hypothetical protein